MRRTVTVEPLTPEAFAEFGTFADLIDPPEEARLSAAEKPVEFFPDLVQIDLEAEDPSISTCKAWPRPLVVNVTEFHRSTGEGILPLDGDVVIHVGTPTEDGQPPLDQIRAFLVPQGTQVAIKPGVFHHGPFACGDNPVSVQIILPERTYVMDCTPVPLGEDDQIEVVMPAA